MKNALGEFLALLQLAQFLAEQGALVLNCPKPALGFGVRALAAGEAPLEVTRERKSHAAKDQGRCARKD
jgi:hypothetical protein